MTDATKPSNVASSSASSSEPAGRAQPPKARDGHAVSDQTPGRLYRRRSRVVGFFVTRCGRGDDLTAEAVRHRLRPAFPLIDFGELRKDRPALERAPHVTGIVALVCFDQPTTRSGAGLFRFRHTRHASVFLFRWFERFHAFYRQTAKPPKPAGGKHPVIFWLYPINTALPKARWLNTRACLHRAGLCLSPAKEALPKTTPPLVKRLRQLLNAPIFFVE